MQLNRALFCWSGPTTYLGAYLISVCLNMASLAREYSTQRERDSKSIGLSFQLRSNICAITLMVLGDTIAKGPAFPAGPTSHLIIGALCTAWKPGALLRPRLHVVDRITVDCDGCRVLQRLDIVFREYRSIDSDR